MQAGDLRRFVSFQAKSSTLDSFGQQVETWTDVFTAWAQIQALSANEILAAQAVNSRVTHTITVRYRAEFANPAQIAALRVLYSGRVFNISGMLNVDERNAEVELPCYEGLNGG